MSSSDESESFTPSNPEVITKYKAAADIINRILKTLIVKSVAGANVYQLCVEGDAEIVKQSGLIYKGKIPKGVAFPTCISVNHCACHFSPSSDSGLVLKDGDLIKIELGAHMDGFPVLLAHSFIVGTTKVTDKRADILQAAHLGAEAALRLIRPGKNNEEVTATVHKILDAFKAKAVEGTLSFQLSKNSLGGEKHVVLNPTDAQKKSVEKCQFEEYEVYAVDIAVTSGEGKIKAGNEKSSIYKKTETNYALKMKASRATLSEITSKFGSMAFNVRTFEEEKKSRLGLIELVNHQLVQAYEPLYEKEGEFVARFMFTVILMPAGPLRITESLFDADSVASKYSVEDASIKELLASDVRKTKANRKKTEDSA